MENIYNKKSFFEAHRVINGTQEKAGYSDPVSYPAFNYLPY